MQKIAALMCLFLATASALRLNKAEDTALTADHVNDKLTLNPAIAQKVEHLTEKIAAALIAQKCPEEENEDWVGYLSDKEGFSESGEVAHKNSICTEAFFFLNTFLETRKKERAFFDESAAAEDIFHDLDLYDHIFSKALLRASIAEELAQCSAEYIKEGLCAEASEAKLKAKERELLDAAKAEHAERTAEILHVQEEKRSIGEDGVFLEPLWIARELKNRKAEMLAEGKSEAEIKADQSSKREQYMEWAKGDADNLKEAYMRELMFVNKIADKIATKRDTIYDMDELHSEIGSLKFKGLRKMQQGRSSERQKMYAMVHNRYESAEWLDKYTADIMEEEGCSAEVARQKAEEKRRRKLQKWLPKVMRDERIIDRILYASFWTRALDKHMKAQ